MEADWPLVGRAKELQRVGALLREGAGGVVFAGPAGVGKTRLARECLDLASAEGFVPVRVAATQAAASLPFGAYAALLPELAPGAERVEVLRQVAGAVTAQGEGKPVALLVDDAHILDDASATLTHYLAAARETFVVATVRAGAPVSDAVTALWEDGLTERLEVSELSRPEAEELLAAVLGRPAEAALAYQLWERTQGNTLFFKELVLAAVDADVLHDDDGVWRLTGKLPTSARLVELVETRLAELPDEARAAIEALTVGEPLGVQPFERLAGSGHLSALETQRLVRVECDGRRQMAHLAHPLYGDVVRSRLSPLRTRALCRTLADLLEATGAQRREDLLRLATWRLDGGGADPALLLKGASQARHRYDYGLGERLARGAASADGGFPAHLAVAQLLCLQGRGADAEEQLAELAACAPDDKARTRVAALRVENLRFLGRYEDGRAAAERALSAVSDPESRDQLEASRAGILIDTDGPAAAAEAAQQLIGRTSGRALVWASIVATFSLGRAGRVAGAEAAADQASSARQTLRGPPDDRVEATRVLALAETMTAAGRYQEAEAAAAAQYESAVSRGALDIQAWAAGQMAKLFLGRGRVESAARYAREAAALNLQLQRPTYLRESLVSRATAEALAGRPADATLLLAEIDRLGLPLSWWTEVDLQIARAWTAAAAGDRPGARAILGEATKLGTSVGDMTRVCAALHDLARLGGAAQVAARLAELSGTVEGPLAPARAAHAAALRSQDPAALEEASVCFESIGALLLAAEAAADAAVAWRKAGDARRAATAERRSQMVADACEGARTPALTAVTARTALTPRELEIARLAAAGVANKEIAARLQVSLHTVQNKLHAAYEKLGVNGRSELAQVLEGY